MLCILLGLSIGGIILYIVHKLTTTSSKTNITKEIQPVDKKVIKTPVKMSIQREEDKEYRRAFEILKKACNYGNNNEYISRTMRKPVPFKEAPVKQDLYSTGSDISVGETVPYVKCLEIRDSISSDSYTSPISAMSDRYTDISESSSALKQTETLIFNEQELHIMVKLEVERIRAERGEKQRVDIKKEREADRKVELETEVKIIQNKEELGQCINNKSECKVIVTKSILDQYSNDKLISEKIKIERVSIVKSIKLNLNYYYTLIMNTLHNVSLVGIKISHLMYDAMCIILLHLDVWKYQKSKELNIKIVQIRIELQELQIEKDRLDIEYENWLLF